MTRKEQQVLMALVYDFKSLLALGGPVPVKEYDSIRDAEQLLDELVTGNMKAVISPPRTKGG